MCQNTRFFHVFNMYFLGSLEDIQMFWKYIIIFNKCNCFYFYIHFIVRGQRKYIMHMHRTRLTQIIRYKAKLVITRVNKSRTDTKS